MKKFLALILPYCFGFGVNAQIQVYQTRLRDSTAKVFYIGIDNILTIKNMCAGCVLKMTSGEVKKWYESNDYSVRVATPDTVTLKIYQHNKPLFSAQYKSCYIPDPVARLGIVKDSFATVNQILAYPQMIAIMDGCLLRATYVISNFNIAFKTNAPGPDHFTMLGPSLTNNNDVMKIIRLLRRGDKIFIDNIRTHSPDGRARAMNPIIITIR